MKKDKYCEYCDKLIGKPGKIYMAGSICEGHRIPIFWFILWKLFKIKNLKY